MTCAGSNPHGGWCCQGDYDCSQDTLNEPKCADSSWDLYGKGGIVDAGAWCCLHGYRGFVEDNGGVGCTPISVTELSTGWSFGATVQTYSCETPTTSGSSTTSTPASSSTTQSTSTISSLPTTSSTSIATDHDDSQLPPGQIAGITIGAAAVLVLICLAIILKKKWSTKKLSPEASNQPKAPQTDNTAPNTVAEPVFSPRQELHNDPASIGALGNQERGRVAHELSQSNY
ncbi:hypothetical protein G7054_g12443 [Neopestalotiopsis clavispora]|nr:hypothetical protein G7054_g12443 [Neopestalotiopsis clavispora]